MEPAAIRQKLHQYIDKGDNTLLKLLYALAKEYNNEEDLTHDFTEEDIQQFKERSLKRLNGESKTYNWKEAKEIITGKQRENEL